MKRREPTASLQRIEVKKHQQQNHTKEPFYAHLCQGRTRQELNERTPPAHNAHFFFFAPLSRTHTARISCISTAGRRRRCRRETATRPQPGQKGGQQKQGWPSRERRCLADCEKKTAGVKLLRDSRQKKNLGVWLENETRKSQKFAYFADFVTSVPQASPQTCISASW